MTVSNLNLSPALKKLFGDELVGFLRQLGGYFEEHQASSFLVGGMSRDALLGISSVDIDISLQTSTIDTAPQIVEELFENWKSHFPNRALPTSWESYEAFLTAKLLFAKPIFNSCEVIDFATARGETYDGVGVRPVVWPATIEEDLLRRDFSVNAIAVSLKPGNFGSVIDPMKGVADINQRKLRVLHPKSFIDDPVRLLRGIRLIARLGFIWDKETEILAQSAIAEGCIKAVSPARRFEELKKALIESSGSVVVELCRNRSLILQITDTPGMEIAESIAPLIEGTTHEGVLIEPWQWRLVTLFSPSPSESFEQFLKNSAISRRERALLVSLQRTLINN